jgi:hypothetical protein
VREVRGGDPGSGQVEQSRAQAVPDNVVVVAVEQQGRQVEGAVPGDDRIRSGSSRAMVASPGVPVPGSSGVPGRSSCTQNTMPSA